MPSNDLSNSTFLSGDNQNSSEQFNILATNATSSLQRRPNSNTKQEDTSYNLKVYWMTPLGKALHSSMEELGLSEELKDRIKKKYEDAIEKEFANLPAPRHNHASSRFKMSANCKSYNNIY